MNTFEQQTETVFLLKHDATTMIRNQGISMLMEDDEKEFYTYQEWMEPFISKAFVKIIRPNGASLFESVKFEKQRRQRLAGPVSGAYMRFTDDWGRPRIVSLFGDYHETTTVCNDSKTIASAFHDIFSRNSIPLDVFGEVARTPLHRVQSAAKREMHNKGPLARDKTGVVQFAKELKEAGGRKGYFTLEDNSSGEKVDTLAKWNYMILACQSTNKFLSCPSSIRFHWSDLRGDIDLLFRERVFDVSSFIFPDQRKRWIGETFAYLYQKLTPQDFAMFMFQRVLLDPAALDRAPNPIAILSQVQTFFDWCISNNFAINRDIPTDVVSPVVSLFGIKRYPQKTFSRLFYDSATKRVAKAILVLCAETLYKTVTDTTWRSDLDKWVRAKYYESQYPVDADAPLFSFVQDLSVLTRLERRWDVTKHAEYFHLDYSPVGIVYSGDAHVARMKHFYTSVYSIKDIGRATELTHKCISFGTMPLELLLVPTLKTSSYSTLVMLPKHSGYDLDLGHPTPRQLLTEKVEAKTKKDLEKAKTWTQWFGLDKILTGQKKVEPIPLPPAYGPVKQYKTLEPVYPKAPSAASLLKQQIRTYEQPIPPPPKSNVKNLYPVKAPTFGAPQALATKGVTKLTASNLKRKNPNAKAVEVDTSFWKQQTQTPAQRAIQEEFLLRQKNKPLFGAQLQKEFGLNQKQMEYVLNGPKPAFTQAFIHNPSSVHVHVKKEKKKTSKSKSVGKKKSPVKKIKSKKPKQK